MTTKGLKESKTPKKESKSRDRKVTKLEDDDFVVDFNNFATASFSLDDKGGVVSACAPTLANPPCEGLTAVGKSVSSRDPVKEEKKDSPTVLSEDRNTGIGGFITTGKLSLKTVRANPHFLWGLPAEQLKLARGFFFPAHRVFKINLGYARSYSTDSSGNWGGSSSGDNFPINLITSAAEWASAQALFDEVFIMRVRQAFWPHNRYTQYNLQTSAASGHIFSTAINWCSLHHGAAVYTTFSGSNANPTTRTHYAGDPSVFVWVNIEKMTPQGPSSSIAGTAYVGQGWCNTNTTTIGGYTGSTQSIGCAAMGGYTTTVEIGRAAVVFECAFRNRA